MYIGFDIGGTNIKYGLFHEDKLIEFKTIKTSDGEILKAMKSVISKYENIKGIGIAAAGLVNYNDEVVFSPNINEFRNVNFKKVFEKYCKNVKAINDVNAMALCELKYGYGRNYKNFIVLAIGTGVGGAVVINRKLYLGTNGFAGELGHVKISLKGRRCRCGRIGCLESFVGRRYVLERLPSNVDMIDVYLYAKRGNKFYLNVLKKISKYLSIAIANFVNILDPEAVILSGGVANDIILKFTKEYLENEKIYRSIDILLSNFKDKAGVIGAVINILHPEYIL